MAYKTKEINPFSVLSYLGIDYFCDRENETKQLKEALENGRNVHGGQTPFFPKHTDVPAI